MKVFLYYFLKTRDITIIQIKYYRCQTKGIVQNIPASHFDPIFIFFLLWNTKGAVKQNIQGRFHISKVDGHEKKKFLIKISAVHINIHFHFKETRSS